MSIHEFDPNIPFLAGAGLSEPFVGYTGCDPSWFENMPTDDYIPKCPDPRLQNNNFYIYKMFSAIFKCGGCNVKYDLDDKGDVFNCLYDEDVMEHEMSTIIRWHDIYQCVKCEKFSCKNCLIIFHEDYYCKKCVETCKYHSKINDIYCVGCDKFTCIDCVYNIGGETYCPSCIVKCFRENEDQDKCKICEQLFYTFYLDNYKCFDCSPIETKVLRCTGCSKLKKIINVNVFFRDNNDVGCIDCLSEFTCEKHGIKKLEFCDWCSEVYCSICDIKVINEEHICKKCDESR